MFRRRGLILLTGTALALWVAVPFASAQTGRGQRQNAGGGGRQGQGNARQGGPGGGFGGLGAIMSDPEAQVRMLRMQVSTRQRGGGPGGRGGGMQFMGSGGGGILGLLMRSVPLQEEIGLTADQKKQLEEINQNSREKMRQFFQQQGGQQGGGQGGRGNNAQQPARGGQARGGQQDVVVNVTGGGGPGGAGGQQGPGGRFGGNFDPAQFQAMQESMQQMRQENDAAVTKLLKPAQMKRLNEIRLRILDVFAVAEEDVAIALKLQEEQFANIQQIMQDMDEENGELMREQFQNMGNMFGFGRGGPGGSGDQAGPGGGGQGRRNAAAPTGAAGGAVGNRNAARPPAKGAEEDDPEADNANANGNNGRQGGRQGGFNFTMTDEQRQELETAAKEMNKKQTALENKYKKLIGQVLLPGQKTSFNKMLGAPFDLAKLAQPPQGPQNGRRGRGGDAEADDASAPPPNGRVRQPANRGGDAGEATGEDDESGDAPAAPANKTQRTRPAPRVRGSGGN